MTAYVNTNNGGTLNMRLSPSTNSKVLAQIPNGTKLEIEKYDTTWAKSTYQQNTGYIMLKFLSDTNLSISKSDLQRIYNDLKTVLSTIESILK